MSIIREKIRRNGLNISGITITLDSNIGFMGYQQEIDNLTKATSDKIINPVVDVEKRKFKPAASLTKFQFTFNNLISFTGAGFKPYEISGSTPNMLNSFFILDYYDTYNPNTQTKIFTTYLTKIGNVPTYNVSANTGNQLYYWYVPISYTAALTGSTATGYTKLSFYNAKSGITSIFYNHYNAAAPIGLTPEKLYFKTKLNLTNRTWEILNLTNNIVDARTLTTSVAYDDRINNTYDKYNSIKQLYPTGGTVYDYRSNKYISISGNTI